MSDFTFRVVYGRPTVGHHLTPAAYEPVQVLSLHDEAVDVVAQGLDGAHGRSGRSVTEEADQMGRPAGNGTERRGARDLREFGRGAHERRDVVAERRSELRLDGTLEGRWPSRCGEHDVAARDERGDVRVAERLELVPQRRHAHAVTADVDAREERHEGVSGGHRDTVRGTMGG